MILKKYNFPTENQEAMKAVNPKATAVLAAQNRSFPDEFKQSVWDALDKRYIAILLSTFAIVYGLMITFALTYEAPNSNEFVKAQFMAKILQKSVARLDLEQPRVETPTAVDTPTEAAAEVKKESAKGKTADEVKSEEFKQARAEAAAEKQAEVKAATAAAAAAAIARIGAVSKLSRSTASGGDPGVNLGLATSSSSLSSSLSGAAAGKAFASARSSDLGGRASGGGAQLADIGAIKSGAASASGTKVGTAGGIKTTVSTRPVKTAAGGSRSGEQLTAVISRESRGVQACYEGEKIKDPSLRGEITIEIRIAKDGRVQAPRVASSTMKNAAVERCILNKIRLWQFDAVTDSKVQVVSIPFVFSD